MSTNVNGNCGCNIFAMRAQSDKEWGSSMSNQARDAMEAFSPQNILGMIMQIFKLLLGVLSG